MLLLYQLTSLSPAAPIAMLPELGRPKLEAVEADAPAPPVASALPKGENSSSSSSPAPACDLFARLDADALLRDSQLSVRPTGTKEGRVRGRPVEVVLELEPVRGLNSMAATLSLGEPKGEGDAGRLPPSPRGKEEMGDRGGSRPGGGGVLEPPTERLDRVRFQRRGDARGLPEPMTPARGLAGVVSGVEPPRLGVEGPGVWRVLSRKEWVCVGVVGVQGRDPEKERLDMALPGRRAGDEMKLAPVGLRSSRCRCMISSTILSKRTEGWCIRRR